MNLQIVQIGDMRVSKCPDDVLVTYALGSCVAVLIYDPVPKVAGLLHVLLPDSRLDRVRAQQNPLTFADTGIPMLFHEAYALGASKPRLRVSIAGGAHVNASGSFFNVGNENVRAVKALLERAKVPLQSEAVGGTSARTVRIHVGTGQIAMQQTETGTAKHG
jgi:chemotaxis protein CheD